VLSAFGIRIRTGLTRLVVTTERMLLEAIRRLSVIAGVLQLPAVPLS